MTTVTLKTIALDFDGVIHQYEGWKGSDQWNDPLPLAIWFLQELKRRDYRVVIHTAREAPGVWDWLKEHDLVYLVSDVSKTKPRAVAYVDDRGIRFRGDFGEVLGHLEDAPWWKDRLACRRCSKEMSNEDANRCKVCDAALCDYCMKLVRCEVYCVVCHRLEKEQIAEKENTPVSDACVYCGKKPDEDSCLSCFECSQPLCDDCFRVLDYDTTVYCPDCFDDLEDNGRRHTEP